MHFASMHVYRDLNVLDAAEHLAVQVAELSERMGTRLLYNSQMQRSSQSISANIGEAFGRESVADRNRALVIARGEAEETIRHLRTNFRRSRVEAKEYWQLHNR